MKKLLSVSCLVLLLATVVFAQAATDDPIDPYAGMDNLALNAQATDSGHQQSYTTNKALDGSTVTYWEGAPKAFPDLFTIDLGEVKSFKALRLKLNPKRIWGPRSQTIEVQTSNDGTTFKTALAEAKYAFDPIENQNTVTIVLEGKTQFIRLIFFANSESTGGQIAELEVLGSK